MGVVFGAVAILLLILLTLRIIQILGGTKTRITIDYSENMQDGSPGGLTPMPPMPERTSEQIGAIIEGGQTEWVTYPGMTPPLRMKMRGQSLEGYRWVLRAHAVELGFADLADIPTQMRDALTHVVMARAYVTDWEGPSYPNGVAMPYSPANLASFMDRDDALFNFVAENAHRISPPWPAV